MYSLQISTCMNIDIIYERFSPKETDTHSVDTDDCRVSGVSQSHLKTVGQSERAVQRHCRHLYVHMYQVHVRVW